MVDSKTIPSRAEAADCQTIIEELSRRVHQERCKLQSFLDCTPDWVWAMSEQYPGDRRIGEAAQERLRLQEDVEDIPDEEILASRVFWERSRGLEVDHLGFFVVVHDITMSIGFERHFSSASAWLKCMMEDCREKAYDEVRAWEFDLLFNQPLVQHGVFSRHT